MEKKRWEQWELKFLEDNVNSMSKMELSSSLCRSVGSINRMIARKKLLEKIGIHWTQDELDILTKHYPSSRYVDFIYLLNRTKYQIMLKANSMGIKREMKDASEFRNYTLNEDYFKVIDTENKAYYLGWAFSDGNVIPSQYRIRLNSIDKEILAKMLIEFNSNSPIYQRGKNSEINMCSTLFAKNLINMGCTPNKTFTIEYPDIPIEYTFDFLKGCFDGDGSYVFTDKTKKINFCSASYNFIYKVSSVLKDNNIHNYIYTVGKTHYISISGKKNLQKYLSIILNTKSDFLERKKSKMKLLYEYSLSKRLTVKSSD